MTQIKRVGFVGLGIMGSRMAANLAKKGFEVVVWNRSRDKAEALARAEKSVSVVDSAAAVARTTDAYCTCVADFTALSAVVLGERGLLVGAREGQLHLDFSTVSPEQAKELERASAQKKVDFLAAPVTGSKTGAEKGTLLVMAGGSEKALERARPVLAAVSEKVIHCGDVAAAATVKLIGNALLAQMLEALCEGLVVAERAGVPAAKVLEVVQASGYRSPYFDFKGKALIAGDYGTHFSVDLLIKDLKLFAERAQKLGVGIPGADATRGVYEQVRKLGFGEEDIGAVVKALAPGGLPGASTA